MICFGSIGPTTVAAVTDSAATAYTAESPANTSNMKRYRLIVSSDKAIHIDVNNVADPSSSPRIPSENVVEFSIFGGDTVSVILAAGETDGSVWITVAG